jgi:hypothetical protein
MALTKYTAAPPPIRNMAIWLYGELRKIETANSSIINLLEALGDKPIEIGPADSAGVGFRVLRIPN